MVHVCVSEFFQFLCHQQNKHNNVGTKRFPIKVLSDSYTTLYFVDFIYHIHGTLQFKSDILSKPSYVVHFI